MSHHGALVPAPPDRQYRAERDPRAWVAPALATVLGAVLAPLALLFGALSVMATDSCGPDDCSPALTTALDVVHGTLFLGGLLAVAACAASWLLPWTRRWSVARLWLAGLSLLPWLCVLALVFHLPEG
ncbi:hypothetical protein HTV80_22495 [Streptomyces sp. Vc74B-19]|uniref:hypothetical protein n=1 Tax=unclassified Streptomyces TaxID=2593676 RepID=UPI001BFBF5E9|nr:MULTISPECIES: hypothetical protein [unclassified Streptomyces]MBT3165855.1 hypothetical protein [Streptomyces sp. Vc74B-19]MCO4695723.1 hypothetical protein [Streptomyces sp. RO-S4]MDU0304841.1 hypothetical protein [Streptomyces sp. PAL114]